MDKKPINLNNLEKFLEKAKSKLEEGIEDIGANNMNKLGDFLSEIRNEKIKKLNLNSTTNTNNIGLSEQTDLFDFEKFKNANLNKDNKENKISETAEETEQKAANEDLVMEVTYNKDLLTQMENETLQKTDLFDVDGLQQQKTESQN